MPNSVIRTKTIFLFGAYPEYLQKKVIKEMRRRKYTVKQPKTLNGLKLDGDDVIVVDVRDMDDWKEQIGQRKDANYVPIETYVSCSTTLPRRKILERAKINAEYLEKQLKNVAAGKTEWHYPKKNTKKKLKQRQLYC